MLPLLASIGRLAISSKVGKKVADEGAKKSGKKIAEKVFNRNKESPIESTGGGKGSALVKVPKISTKIISADSLLGTEKEDESEKKDAAKITESFFDDILNTLQSIKITLNRIQETLNERKKISLEDETTERKETSKRRSGKREAKLETKSKKGSLGKLKFETSGIPFIDRIMNFFGMVLIGSLVLFLYKKINEIIKFFEETFLKIQEFFKAIEPFVKPIWDGMKWIVGGGANIIAKILGIPSQEADTNSISKNLEEITKKIPVIGDLFKGIQDTIDSIRGYKEPSSDGGSTSSGGGYVAPAVGSKQGAYDVASRIGANKQQWDTYRNTIAQIESGGRYEAVGGSGDYYDGRYQMGGEAKTDAARILGIPNPGHSSNPNDPRRVAFRRNPELQERMFAAYTLANHGYLSSDANYQAKQTVEQKLQVLGYAHNQGAGGASKWMRTGKVGKDGFGTSGTKYSNALREAFKKSPSYRQTIADTTARAAATQNQISSTPSSSGTPAQLSTSAPGTSTPASSGTPSALTTPVPAPAPAQVSLTQAPPAVSASVPQIMQQAEYETQGTQNNIFMIGSGNSPNVSMSSGSRSLLLSMSKKEALNSYYQSQLIGFLYKQG